LVKHWRYQRQGKDYNDEASDKIDEYGSGTPR
jgi:hypothetical protein